ncbi:MAG: methylmalonyl-CoA mutase family protein, partial [Kofleriaceae bacterium]
QVEAAAWEYIHKIDAMGGIVKAVEAGYPQREIARSAFEFQRDVDAGRRAIVGVNKYASPGDDAHIPTLAIDPAVERSQVERIQAFRRARDTAAVERALAAVREALRDDRQNVMPPILDAVKQRATLGEICDLFRSELGEYRDPAYL